MALQGGIHFPGLPSVRAFVSKLMPGHGGSKASETGKLAEAESHHGLNYHHGNANPKGYPFFMPPKSLLGPHALAGAGEAIQSLRYKKALIVADAALVEHGAAAPLYKMLDSIGVQHATYTGAAPNPTVAQVAAGVEAFRKHCCDFLISFGGGSMHDCCKAVGIVANGGGKVQDYEGVDKCIDGMVPMVAINTTAGTAAELTRFAIITDTERKVKMAIIDARSTPAIAVNDPCLMLAMPPALTAATGMDALTHAIEAYVSTQSTPLTDAPALHAIRLISAYLLPAFKDGNNLKARDMMAYAEYLAGMAFNSAGLGYVHAIAHQLGGFYDAPHGVCNAVLLPIVQEFNSAAVPELFVDIAEAMGCHPHDACGDPQAAVAAVLDRLKSMNEALELPENIAALGVRAEDFDVLAEHAMADPCGATNPRQPSKEDVVALLQRAHQQTYTYLLGYRVEKES